MNKLNKPKISNKVVCKYGVMFPVPKEKECCSIDNKENLIYIGDRVSSFGNHAQHRCIICGAIYEITEVKT